MILFILIFSILYLALNYYVYIRIRDGLTLSTGVSKILLLVFVLAALSFIPAELLNRNFNAEWVSPVLYLSFIWLGLAAIAFFVFLIADVLRIFIRSRKFRYYATISALLLIGLTSGYCIYNQAGRPIVKEVIIPISKLPPGLSGFIVVQLSDLHLDLSKTESRLENIIEQTLSLHPDLIVITGDLIDADICRVDDYCKILRKLKAKHGVYAITGNHEYFTGIPLFLEIAENSNIKVLRNKSVLIAGAIGLAGIDDTHGAKRFDNLSKEDTLSKALEKVDLSKPVILLSHQPDVFDLARNMGVNLQLSGHTHAGQIPPMDLLVQILFKYPFGLYKRASSYLYTTCGTAFWGPPMRLFSKPEIVKITLVAKRE